MADRNCLIVGARPESLGEELARQARGLWGTIATTVEPPEWDITNDKDVRHTIDGDHYDTVICTVGVNYQPQEDDYEMTLLNHMHVNAVGPLNLLHYWLDKLDEEEDILAATPTFVVVSSNSAHIARSGSVAYCASKAALSMGIRCEARAHADDQVNIWGVEPGWIEDTPMSKEIMERFGEITPRHMHRIPGQRTLERSALAAFILSNIIQEFDWLNGCMLRLDGGEQ